MARTLWLSLLLLSTLGCARSRGTQAPVPAAPRSSATPQPPSRELASDARYGDLVRSATELEPSAPPSGTCLLTARGGGFALTAEVASSVRPLPIPPSDLDELLKRAAHVDLLGPWGRYGSGDAPLALAAFTLHAPAPRALALIVTDLGIALRGPSGGASIARDGLSPEQLASALPPREGSIVFVSAEATVPLSTLSELLDQLTREGRSVSLATPLAPDTRLPPSVSASAPPSGCDDGLSATDAPEGSIPDGELARGLQPLREALPDCLVRGDAPGAAGGRVVLAFRINESGRVQESCLSSDDIGDPGVAACVTGLARSLRFEPPSPKGVLDIELPLALRPAVGATLPPFCAR